MDGSGAFERIHTIASQFDNGHNNVLFTSSGVQSNEILHILQSPQLTRSSTATLDSCTCAVIKPHSVKSFDTGRIIDEIISQGYEISAIASRRLDRVQAEEVLEVYRGVLPDYIDHVSQLCSGVCVAMEVTPRCYASLFMPYIRMLLLFIRKDY
jgi:nucleoside-diphosphate kinase